MSLRDADALDPLMGVMAAAGRHDATAAHRLLDEAEGHLPPGRHKARPEIQAARDAVDAGEWVTVWTKAHHAICGLTWAWPPDFSACPPRPGPTPYSGESPRCVTCCTEVRPQARFCPFCGTGLTRSVPGGVQGGLSTARRRN